MPPLDPSRGTVLVTGASSGIGRATAHLLSERGATLVLLSRSEESLAVVRRECLERGASDVEVAAVDVRDAAAVDAVVLATVGRTGRLDGVVHAAAVLAYGRFTEVPVDVFDRIVETDVLGTANVARSALRAFERQQRGTLVVLGSVLGKIAAPTMSPYCTSKWAVHGLVRTLQVEARATPGVTVSLVSPGGVDTPIYDQAGTYTGHSGQPPPPVVSADRVAVRVVAALDRPRREVGVGPANPLMVLGSRLLPGVFDRAVGPLMSLLGQSRARVRPTSGNVFEPRPELEATRGRWPHLWGWPPSSPRPATVGEKEAVTGMDMTTRTIDAPPAKVWDVLADGWLYPLWVVGASHMREVDDGWPAVGARLHHSAGAWPLVVADTTEVTEVTPGHRLRLRARGWPAGEADVIVVLVDRGAQTLVELHEDATSGPGRLVPRLVRHPMIHARNVEALRRLAAVAERR